MDRHQILSGPRYRGPDPYQEKFEKMDELGQALVDPWLHSNNVMVCLTK